MNSPGSPSRFACLSFGAALLALGCGDSGHRIGQANTGGAGGGATGAGGGSGGASSSSGGTTGHGGSSGTTGGAAGGGRGGGPGGGAGGGLAGTGTGGAAGRGGTGGAGGRGGVGGAGGRGGTAGAAGATGQGGQGGQGGLGGAQICSELPLVACPADQVCDYDTPKRCAAGAQLGHCIVLPGGCTTDYNPVCGCDGKTYSNDCARAMARAQLDHTGACGSTGGAGAGGAGAGGAGGSCANPCVVSASLPACLTPLPIGAICPSNPNCCDGNHVFHCGLCVNETCQWTESCNP